MGLGAINTSNFYRSTLNSTINNTDEAGTFIVSAVTVNGVTLPTTGFYRIVVDFGNADELEIFRITSRSGTTLTYDRRISPNGKFVHNANELVQMNDFSEVINLLGDNTDTLGYIEDVPGTGDELKVKVYGGRLYKEGAVDVVIADLEITLADATTNYIYIDDNLDVFASTTIEPTSYYVVGKVVTAAGDVSSITDYRSKITAPGSGGGGSGGHTVKDTERDSDTPATTYAQRDTLAFRKFKLSDDGINLQTIVEAEWLGTPDVIAVGDTVYIDADTQMVLEGSITVNGTLDNSGKLCIL